MRLVVPRKPEGYLEQLHENRRAKGKASKNLFEAIEQDIKAKEEFLSKQLAHLQQMVTSYESVVAQLQVLKHANLLLRE